MLLNENFTEEHIRALQIKSKRDPILLERSVYAFGLLEALAIVKLPFIFKGGTSLMLLLEKPQRLSTDIDIIVEPNTDIDAYIEKASVIFPFKKVEEQKRIGKNAIEKRHFKFSYDSPINDRPLYILLDVLFENNHYNYLLEKEINNELLLTKSDNLKVYVPSVDDILADKLTAFAPHTIGILLNTGKDMEVIKQFFDITNLIKEHTDIRKIKETYIKIAQSEADYRGLTLTSNEYLWDTFNGALCLASRGKTKQEDYKTYVKGIREVKGHIYQQNYTPEIAAIDATMVMYFVLCLLYNREFVFIKNKDLFKNIIINHPMLYSLKYFKKIDLEAYGYVIESDLLLKNNI